MRCAACPRRLKESESVAPITEDNPTGIESFDHSHIAELPEYAAASRALHKLVQALNRAGTEVGQREWLRIVRQMASALAYTDICLACSNVFDPSEDELAGPIGAEVDDGWLDGRFRCPRCGHSWTCGIAVTDAGYM
jgi:hypothetical protein